MFTGLVGTVGRIVGLDDMPAGRRFRIGCDWSADRFAIGASVACGGPCLTVVDAVPTDGGSIFSVDVSPETLGRTTLGDWRIGKRVNLEASLRLGDELGGHLVTGHVDGTAMVTERRDDGDTVRFAFDVPPELTRFVAEKGSICLDGTSLTVNGVDRTACWVTLIPHTLAVTTWAERQPGDRVNLEIDLLARYVARLQEARA